MKRFSLAEAAAFLLIHPVTLAAKARTGEIKAAKVGRRWVFLEIDLVSHLNALYYDRQQATVSGPLRKDNKWPFTVAKIHPSGGFVSHTTADAYNSLLERSSDQKP